MKSKRPTFEEIYMNLAIGMARRSTCSRRQVGAVITSTDFRKVISVGYNGSGSGMPNECDRPNDSGNCGCLHAEENAIINCDTPRYVEKYFFTTVLPCTYCAKRIINFGNVKKVFFLEEYRKLDSLYILNEFEIEVYQMDLVTGKAERCI